jgi:hypothetical protein
MTNPFPRNVRLVMLLLLSASTGRSQGLQVAGIALDPSGASVGNAVVELEGPFGVQCTLTDDLGKFALELLTPGDYELRISAPNFETCAQRLSIEESLTNVVTRRRNGYPGFRHGRRRIRAYGDGFASVRGSS